MNKLRQLFPLVDEDLDSLRPVDILQIWQEKILQTSLLLAALFGIVISIYSLKPAIANGNWTFLIACILITICSAALFLLRQFKPHLRSLIALILYFVFTNLVFLHKGWFGLPLLLLLGISVLCTALLQKKEAYLGWSLCFISLIIWAIIGNSPTTTMPAASSVTVDVILALLSGFVVNLAIDSLRARVLREHELYSNTRMQVSQLEEKISNGKKEVENNLRQLRVSTELSRIATSTLDPQMKHKKMADLLQEQLDLCYVGIFLIDQTGEYAVLHYGTGDAGRQMLSSSYRLAIGGYSLVGKCIQTNQIKTISVNDTEAVLFENPFLPASQYEMAIPLTSAAGITGVLNVNSADAEGFDQNTQTILQEAADLLVLSLNKDLSLTTLNENQRFGQKYSPLGEQKDEVIKTEITHTFVNPLNPPSGLNSNSIQIPLILRNETIGTIDLEIEGKELPREQRELIQTVADQTSIALENASLLDHSIRHAEHERKVLEITSRIRSTNDSKQMLEITLDELSRSLGVSKAQIVLNVPERPQDENSEAASDTKSLKRKLTTGELREP